MQKRDRSAECFMKIESRRRYSVSCRHRYPFERQCFRKILDSIFPADIYVPTYRIRYRHFIYTHTAKILRAREMNISYRTV